MYSDDDLQAAVEAGVLNREAVDGFRAFMVQQRHTPAVDEEHFRLLTGFNDIFVTIALALVLSAMGWLVGRAVHPAAGAICVCAASWGLAEYFTRRRRMALPSMVLLLSFVGSVFIGGMWTMEAMKVPPLGTPEFSKMVTISMSVVSVLSALAAYAHWRRFRVPVTVAAGVGAVFAGGLVIAKMAWADLDLTMLALLAGGASFGLAMYWDMGDRTRTTRRSDVAFWLHLLAAPLIVHPAFHLLGLLSDGGAGPARALTAIGIYVVLALVALAVDRRALLVSALAYVIYAMGSLLDSSGGMGEGFALTALVIGSALLLLSAAWHRARKPVLAVLPPGLRAMLPAV